jgi:CRP-like cAMP-binding protein
MSVSAPTTRNWLLKAMSPDDLALVTPHLRHVPLKVKQTLETPNKQIKYNYFIDDGLASIIAIGENERRLEVGIIGRDGVTGLAVIMGVDRSPNETFIQVAGEGSRIESAKLRQLMQRSQTLQDLLLNYVHAFTIQTTHTALANGIGKLEERLARWLLMANDRLDANVVPLTHEFLSLMLGVRRAGVTVALHLLAQKGLISLSRGRIEIIDRKGLEKSTKGTYGASEAASKRIFDRKKQAAKK